MYNFFSFPYLFIFQKDEVYLNLVLEYIPDTVYKVARHYSKLRQTIPINYIKVYYYLKSTPYYYDFNEFIL